MADQGVSMPAREGGDEIEEEGAVADDEDVSAACSGLRGSGGHRCEYAPNVPFAPPNFRRVALQHQLESELHGIPCVCASRLKRHPRLILAHRV